MRHGQDDESRVGGWSDVSLIDEGRQEVLETAEWIKDNLSIKRIVASDIKRARESAEIVSDVLGIPFSLNKKLREQSKGVLSGQIKDEIYQVYPRLRP